MMFGEATSYVDQCQNLTSNSRNGTNDVLLRRIASRFLQLVTHFVTHVFLPTFIMLNDGKLTIRTKLHVFPRLKYNLYCNLRAPIR